jgi:hypothetical protein
MDEFGALVEYGQELGHDQFLGTAASNGPIIPAPDDELLQNTGGMTACWRNSNRSDK